MCGRFRVTQDWSEIERRFGAKLSQRVLEQHEPRYNVAPTDPVIAIRQRDGEREADYLRWGLVPHWSKRADDQGEGGYARRDLDFFAFRRLRSTGLFPSSTGRFAMPV